MIRSNELSRLCVVGVVAGAVGVAVASLLGQGAQPQKPTGDSELDAALAVPLDDKAAPTLEDRIEAARLRVAANQTQGQIVLADGFPIMVYPDGSFRACGRVYTNEEGDVFNDVPNLIDPARSGKWQMLPKVEIVAHNGITFNMAIDDGHWIGDQNGNRVLTLSNDDAYDEVAGADAMRRLKDVIASCKAAGTSPTLNWVDGTKTCDLAPNGTAPATAHMRFGDFYDTLTATRKFRLKMLND